MNWNGARKMAALFVLALLALVVVVTRPDPRGTDREKDPESEKGRVHVMVCKDKAGNYISCPPNLRPRESP